MPRALPLCTTCGAWREPCGHPPDPRLRWDPEPLRGIVLELLGMAIFTVLFAAVITGIGPLLWWLAYGWPPRDWIEWLGVIMVALVSLPGAIIGVGLLVSIPEHYRGRRWTARDLAATDADRFTGALVIRNKRPDRGELIRTTRAPLPAPVSFDMTSETAATSTADPGLLFAVAVAGLAARGAVELTTVHRTGWSWHADEPRRAIDHVVVHLRPRGLADGPWLESTLRELVARQPDADLLGLVAGLAYRVAEAIGFEHAVDDDELFWPDDAGNTPAEALQQRLLADLADDAPAPPPDVAAALAAWRAQSPDIARLLDDVAVIARTVLSPTTDGVRP